MSSVVVETRAGKVRGELRSGPHPVRVWRAIPYAAPPVGALRFRAPQPAAAWTGERDATKFGAVAMQSRDSRIATMSGVTNKIETSEDCLTVNVFAPAAPATDGKPRPVMVWLHGGAFVMGSGSTPLYNGASFSARHDIVVVTLNYRLGLLGFMYLGDLLPGRDVGNYALLDQIAALEWVRDHIAAFGGDPAQVTIMGESAGSISVSTLLALPAARGLFHRAIMESGATGLSPPTRDDATKVAKLALEKLGTTADQLEHVPATALVAVQEKLVAELGLGAFFPHVDGATIPGNPTALLADGRSAQIPILAGSNRDELTLFEIFLGRHVLDSVIEPVRAHLGAAFEPLFAAYRASRAGHDERAAWSELVGDAIFRIPLVRLAEHHVDHGGVAYMYRFDWGSPMFDGKLGAAHALELPFVWNRLDLPLSQILLGNDLAALQPFADAIHATWAAFIRTGNPNGGGLPEWPRYDRARRATLRIDRPTSEIVDDPGRATRELWPATA